MSALFPVPHEQKLSACCGLALIWFADCAGSVHRPSQSVGQAMGTEYWVAIAVSGLILAILFALYSQGHKTWHLLTHWQVTTQERERRMGWHAQENRELRAALQEQKAHVDQLQRKLEILQALVPSTSQP